MQRAQTPAMREASSLLEEPLMVAQTPVPVPMGAVVLSAARAGGAAW